LQNFPGVIEVCNNVWGKCEGGCSLQAYEWNRKRGIAVVVSIYSIGLSEFTVFFRIVQMDTKMGTVTLTKPGKTKDEASPEPPKVFTFDTVYDWKLVFLIYLFLHVGSCTQRNVYDETASPIVKSVLDGYNGKHCNG
jgi:hypothetical protein